MVVLLVWIVGTVLDLNLVEFEINENDLGAKLAEEFLIIDQLSDCR